DSRSPRGSESSIRSPGTRTCALASGIPGRSPCRRAASLAALTTRRRPSLAASTSGWSARSVAPPDARLNRSVGQFGRKSETTLLIACLDFEIGALARARPYQLDQPAMPADTGDGQRRRRQG